MPDKDTSIRIMCPNLTCRKVLAVPVSARGKTVRCKSCGIAIRVPVQAGGADANPNPRKTG